MPEVEISTLSNLDSSSETPLFRQIYLALRESILNGAMAPGYKLLPSRTLADRLGISRTTVTQAYRQLLTEGFTESLVGSGTRICSTLPGETPPASPGKSKRKSKNPEIRNVRRLSERGRAFMEERLHYEESHFHAEAFCPAQIDTHNFPHELWGRSLARVWRKHWPSLIGYGAPEGHEPLLKTICNYLEERRQLHCAPEQIIVVGGAQQGLDLSARVLTDAGDWVGLENPGYLGARLAFRAAGAHLASIPVDEDGLSVEHLSKLAQAPRVIYVCPSHQFPTGVSMTLSRRLALLDYAQKNDCWIIEDDYDSEFRYNSRPVASLKSLDEKDRVIYVGSFSKVLHPSLRIGYMVLPPDLLTAFHGAKACSDRQTNVPLQAALVDFLECEEFGRHLKRMRDIYGERREVLVSNLKSRFGDFLELPGRDAAGLHLAALLPPGVDDWQIHLHARKHDLEVNGFTQYSLEKPSRGGLVLGYSGIGRKEIIAGVARLEKVFTELKLL